MEDNECKICLDDIIKTNCYICKNGICNKCLNKIIDRTFVNFNEISYMCPFCKTNNIKEWNNIDKSIIIKYFKDNELELKKEIWKYKELLFDKNVEINRLKTIIIKNHI